MAESQPSWERRQSAEADESDVRSRGFARAQAQNEVVGAAEKSRDKGRNPTDERASTAGNRSASGGGEKDGCSPDDRGGQSRGESACAI